MPSCSNPQIGPRYAITCDPNFPDRDQTVVKFLADGKESSANMQRNFLSSEFEVVGSPTKMLFGMLS